MAIIDRLSFDEGCGEQAALTLLGKVRVLGVDPGIEHGNLDPDTGVGMIGAYADAIEAPGMALAQNVNRRRIRERRQISQLVLDDKIDLRC